MEELHEHQRIVRKICALWAERPQEREDLFQDIVLQLWRSYPSFRGDASFATWAWRVALNTAILGRRRAARRARERQVPDVATAAISPGIAATGDDVALLHACIRELPELDRAIILLHLEGRPHAEIAAVTGLSNGNVDVRVHRIKGRLRDRLLARGYGGE